MVSTEGFKALLHVIIPHIKQIQIERLVKVNDNELANERAKVQGIDIVERQLKDLREYLLGNQAKAK
jgi:hypothetical protein